jgi:hypothetical protein
MTSIVSHVADAARCAWTVGLDALLTAATRRSGAPPAPQVAA